MFDCYQLHEVNSGTANQITQSWNGEKAQSGEEESGKEEWREGRDGWRQIRVCFAWLHNGRFPSSSHARGRSNTFDTDQSLFAPSVHVRARVRPSRVLIASAVSGAKSCRTFGAKNVTTDRYSIFALFETYYIMPFYKLTSDEL